MNFFSPRYIQRVVKKADTLPVDPLLLFTIELIEWGTAYI